MPSQRRDSVFKKSIKLKASGSSDIPEQAEGFPGKEQDVDVHEQQEANPSGEV